MRHTIPPIEMVRLAAERLGELADEVAFLGGAVVGLLVTDPAAREPRPTQDVDVTIEVATRIEYDRLEVRLRELGFQNVMEGPICRFSHGEILLDIMPTVDSVLGFGNAWYAPALATAVKMDVGAGVQARVITAPYFLATKFAAFASPYREGHGDFRASRDFEDIVTVVDGREETVAEVAVAGGEVAEFLREQLVTSFGSPDFLEGVSAHLDVDAASQKRAAIVVDRLRRIAGL